MNIILEYINKRKGIFVGSLIFVNIVTLLFKLSTYKALITIIESNSNILPFFVTLFIIHMIQNLTKYTLSKLISSGIKDLFTKVTKSIMYNKMEFYGRNVDIQNKISHIWHNFNNIENLMEKLIIDLPKIITFICYYIYTIYQLYPHGLLFILPVNLLIIFALHQFSRKQNKLQRKRNTLDIEVKNKLLEATSNIEFVKMNNREDHEINRINESYDKYISNKIQDKLIGFWIDLLYLVFNEFLTVIIYLIGTIYMINGKLNPLELLYVSMNTSSFCIQTMELKDILMKITPKLEILHNILDTKCEDVNKNTDLDKSQELFSNGDINFNNVTFSYDSSINVINNFTCDFKGNKINLLLGPNGSGKSTIVKLLLRLYELKENDDNTNAILFNNINVNNINLKDLRNKIFLVTNEPRLFDGTVMYNIKYGNEHIPDSRVVELCDVIYSRDWLLINKNKQVGFKGKNLSGSEKKKVQLINALCRDAEVLIFDEPTNTLDSTGIEWFNQFAKLLRDKYNKTIIIITHDLRLKDLSDNLVDITLK
ncbi:ABC transporter [Indivirus ILV1]|uniref:ABC transporter n=1 Tax=Indivirus ILV1 TaxID=1977633 RepID=A0A1V0SD74_9VIRU|nr:ABC transporter [Indivirus ILV1]